MFRKYMYILKNDMGYMVIYAPCCYHFVVRSRQVMKSICWFVMLNVDGFDHTQIHTHLKIMKILKW